MNIVIPVLDKEYSISCPADAKDELYESVANLQAICNSIKQKNPQASIDKVLVAAAVNLVSQVSFYRKEMETLINQIETLKDKVDLVD